MRSIKYNDYKKSCKKNWELNCYPIKSIKIKNIFNCKDAVITFNYPIALITGRNGIGKTTVVNAIKHIKGCQNPESTEINFFPLLVDYNLDLENHFERHVQVYNGNIEQTGFNIPNISDLTFNSGLYSFYKECTYQEMVNYKETLRGFNSIPLPGDLISIMKEILNKPIKHVERIVDEDDSKKEYYIITLEGDVCYDSYTMGSGEFYINQLLWGLHELPAKSVVIIEELENYLHSGAQKLILELLHKYSSKHNIQFILTTHSPTLIDHAGEDSLILLQLIDSNICPNLRCPKWLAKDKLGKTIENKVIVLFEDKAAKGLFHTIISNNNPDLLKHLELYSEMNFSCDSKVINVTKTLREIQGLQCIGVVDGDVLNIKEEGYLIKLPSDLPPEKLVFSSGSNFSKNLSTLLNKKETDVQDALNETLTIVDHHEWLSYLSSLLGEEESHLWITLTKVWYMINPDVANEFYSKFEKIYSSLPNAT